MYCEHWTPFSTFITRCVILYVLLFIILYQNVKRHYTHPYDVYDICRYECLNRCLVGGGPKWVVVYVAGKRRSPRGAAAAQVSKEKKRKTEYHIRPHNKFLIIIRHWENAYCMCNTFTIHAGQDIVDVQIIIYTVHVGTRKVIYAKAAV